MAWEPEQQATTGSPERCPRAEVPDATRWVLAVALIGFPIVVLLAGATTYVSFCTIPAIMLLPAVFMRERGESPPSTPDGEDSDGGGGSRRPEPPPRLPGGGIPMLDAEQSSRRYRGEPVRPLRSGRDRRPCRQPDRPPVPAPGGSAAATR